MNHKLHWNLTWWHPYNPYTSRGKKRAEGNMSPKPAWAMETLPQKQARTFSQTVLCGVPSPQAHWVS